MAIVSHPTEGVSTPPTPCHEDRAGRCVLSAEGQDVEALATELRLWRTGQRSTNNFIVGTLSDPEAEQLLIAQSDNARIMALAAELNAALGCAR